MDRGRHAGEQEEPLGFRLGATEDLESAFDVSEGGTNPGFGNHRRCRLRTRRQLLEHGLGLIDPSSNRQTPPEDAENEGAPSREPGRELEVLEALLEVPRRHLGDP